MMCDARAGEAHAVLRFWIRRIFRIAPLYYVWLAFMVVRNYGTHRSWDQAKRFCHS
jgi:peptidoglycan/LPS O-acetylase OafA/YrhL